MFIVCAFESQGKECEVFCLLLFKVHYTTLALLLKFGSDANARDNNGVTPLHYVAMYCENKDVLPSCAQLEQA